MPPAMLSTLPAAPCLAAPPFCAFETLLCPALSEPPWTRPRCSSHPGTTHQTFEAPAPPASCIEPLKHLHPWSRTSAFKKMFPTLPAAFHAVASSWHSRNAHTSHPSQQRFGETIKKRHMHQSLLATYHSHLNDRMSQAAKTHAEALPTRLDLNDLSWEPTQPHLPFSCPAQRDRVVKTSQEARLSIRKSHLATRSRQWRPAWPVRFGVAKRVV